MRRLAIRTLAAHKARLAMTLVAVCLGSAFVAGTLLFTDAAERAELAIPQRTDVAVQVSAAPDGGGLPQSTRDELAGLPGVAHAYPVVSGQGSLLGRDGKVVEDADGVTNFAATARFSITEGRPPGRAGEVALSAPAARASGARVGDMVGMLLGGSRQRARVVGTYEYRVLGQETPPAMAFDTATAQRLLGIPGQLTAVDLVATPGTTAGVLAGRAQAAVPGARVIDAQAANDEARRQRAEETGTLRDVLLGFAAIAVLVGAFVIANTFSMLVGQRTRELGLLRVVGMSRRQLRRMVLAEAAMVGLVGGVVGAAIGYGFAAGAVRFLDDAAGPVPVVVGWLAPLAALAVGVGVTVLSAWASARRAARVPPLAALRGDTALLPGGGFRRRTIAGLLVATLGAAVYGYAAQADRVDEQVGLVGVVGAALLILAVAVVAPALFGRVLGALSAPLARLGATTKLAAGNARRSPQRTGATASALMLSLSVVTGLAIGGQSLKDNVTSSIRRDVGAQFVAEPAGGDATIPQREVEQLDAVPGVESVAALSYALPMMRLGPVTTREPLTVVDPAAVGSALRLSMVSGRTKDFAGGAFVSDDLARVYGLSVGDRVTVRWPKGGEGVFTVTGVFRGSSLVPGVLAPAPAALPHLERTGASVAFVALSPGAGQAAARAGLERAVADRPDVVVRSLAEYLDNRLGSVDVILRASYALLALAVAIGLLGVANTLALAVLERTRELGLLRALGLTRRQVRTVVRVEAALVAVLGGLLGIGGGWLLGAMFQRATLRTGLLDASFPFGQVALALAGLAVVAVAAAAWPARRAARANLLAAIATE